MIDMLARARAEALADGRERAGAVIGGCGGAGYPNAPIGLPITA